MKKEIVEFMLSQVFKATSEMIEIKKEYENGLDNEYKKMNFEKDNKRLEALKKNIKFVEVAIYNFNKLMEDE